MSDGKLELTTFARNNFAVYALSISEKLIATSPTTEAKGLLFRSNVTYIHKTFSIATYKMSNFQIR